MKPNYSNIYSSGRIRPVNMPDQHNNTYSYANMHKSPIQKSGSLNYPYNQPNFIKQSQSTLDNYGSNQQTLVDSAGKERKASIKNLEQKMENMEHLIKNNKNGASTPFKKDFSKMGESSYKPQQDNSGIKRQQSQPDLRTSCPNIFRKFQNNASLRNTTHNNLTKFGAVMAEIKKQEEEEMNMKKKHNEPLTPNKIIKKQSIGLDKQKVNFKSLNQVWNNKLRNNVLAHPSQKLTISQVSNKNCINGFQISKVLGKGKFGEVNLARHIETNFIVALKKMVKSKIIEYKMVEQFKREIRLHSNLDHPNIVKFYGFFEDADNVYLILEFINGGTLFDYLGEKEMLSTKQAAEYLRDTIEAVHYMHERSIAHRDIKPENIVLTCEKVAKLCDFGWSALVQSSRTTYCGTFDYAPPEILERKNYDTAVDIWCIGVLTYEMLTGRVPFEGEKRKEIMQKIISVDKNKINYSVELPQDAKNFIEWLVQKDPESRPKCKQLLKHPFFANNLKNQKQKK